MFHKDANKIHGMRTGVTGVLWRQLKCRQNSSEILLIYVDEFRTSKVQNIIFYLFHDKT